MSACIKAFGVIEAQRRNKWCSSSGVTPAASAIASMVGCARQFSEMKAIARRTES
ncbi:hypothetical protein ACVW1A_002935 [Bradyrhizobium sp. LB1.3]